MSPVIDGQQQPHPSQPKILSWAGELLDSRLLSIPSTNTSSSSLTSSIVTLVVGAEQRLFAAHEDMLCSSPFFTNALRNGYMDPSTKRIALPDEEPEIFSSVLEFFYKGDYYPRLIHNKRRNSWELEPIADESHATPESTIYHHAVDGDLLKDTVIYCAAERYGLSELKKLALRKQGLRKLSPFTKSDTAHADHTRIRHSMQHYSCLGKICLCEHARHRLQAEGSLLGPYHPLSQHVQEKWHHAAGNVQRRDSAIF